MCVDTHFVGRLASMHATSVSSHQNLYYQYQMKNATHTSMLNSRGLHLSVTDFPTSEMFWTMDGHIKCKFQGLYNYIIYIFGALSPPNPLVSMDVCTMIPHRKLAQ